MKKTFSTKISDVISITAFGYTNTKQQFENQSKNHTK